jgi:hypothetical protein
MCSDRNVKAHAHGPRTGSVRLRTRPGSSSCSVCQAALCRLPVQEAVVTSKRAAQLVTGLSRVGGPPRGPACRSSPRRARRCRRRRRAPTSRRHGTCPCAPHHAASPCVRHLPTRRCGPDAPRLELARGTPGSSLGFGGAALLLRCYCAREAQARVGVWVVSVNCHPHAYRDATCPARRERAGKPRSESSLLLA